MKSSILLGVLSFGALLNAQYSDLDHYVAALNGGYTPGDVVSVTFVAPTSTPVALVVYKVNTLNFNDDFLYTTAISGICSQ